MSNRFKEFLATYSGKRLLEKHKLTDYGIWQVKGEDPNCDMGGHHYQPDLGIYEGTLQDVIIFAVDLPSFWTWGGGGDIVKRNIEKVDTTTAQVRNETRALLKALQDQVAQLKSEFNLT